MDIDVVIIGLNVEKTIGACIQSVLNSEYPDPIHIFYVDGGSKDKSVEIAKSYPQVNVIELHRKPPRPGNGRNAGANAGSSPLVQFLDGDTLLDKDWLKKGSEILLKQNLAVISGFRCELHPEKSFFNWTGDLEWKSPVGETTNFGGDVLIRRSVLEETGGYNDSLIAAEDTEYSYRIHLAGNRILQTDLPMTKHDLNLDNLKKMWMRAYRTGYGFAEVRSLFADKNNFWKETVRRVLVRGGGFFLFLILAYWFPLIGILGALLLLFYPMFKFKSLAEEKHLNDVEGLKYAFYCSIVVIPQFFGALKYYRSG
jgi:glycosyltransferase involved in cell wall biosynthesis